MIVIVFYRSLVMFVVFCCFLINDFFDVYRCSLMVIDVCVVFKHMVPLFLRVCYKIPRITAIPVAVVVMV